MVELQELVLVFLPQLRKHRHEEEVGEISDWRSPTIDCDVHQGDFYGDGFSIFVLISEK
jgi:hypothetical protein